MNQQRSLQTINFSEPPILVTKPHQFRRAIDTLSNHTVIAVDTESNSLYAYREQVCLLQFSTPDTDLLIDPLSGIDVSPLSDLFADPGIQVVFHAAEYDVMCLKRDFGFQFNNLFDTMWAARILGWHRVGLGNLLKRFFNVRTNKKYQRYDWGRRPIDEEALKYARLDTHYLLPLRDLQLERLREKGRLEEAREAFEEIAATEPVDLSFDPDDFRSVKGSHKLNRRGEAILRELYRWRDWEARRQDKPHFKILHDQALVGLARRRPRTKKDLYSIPRVSAYHVRRYGKKLLRLVEKGREAPLPPPPPPPPPRHSDTEVDQYEALRAWRKAIAQQRGVEVSVIMTNAVLWAIVDRQPETLEDLKGIEGLGSWKRETYGEDILEVVGQA